MFLVALRGILLLEKKQTSILNQHLDLLFLGWLLRVMDCLERDRWTYWLSLVSGSDHLRQVFSTQMGLSDQDIVALSGAHTLVGGIVQVASVFVFGNLNGVVYA